MRKHTLSLGITAVVFSMLLLAGCSKDSSNPYGSSSTPNPNPSPTPSGNTVIMSGMAFSPATLTVTKGTIVTWTNNDGMAHTSTSDTGVWDTGTIGAGASKTTLFSTVGTFSYHCTFHAGMTGTIVVK